jgi:hypothetical protein
MGISNSNPDLFRAILAMDAYNRGYGAGMKSVGSGPNEGLTGTRIGVATIGIASSSEIGSNQLEASFFAQAYNLDNGPTIISYRGTDTKLYDGIYGYGVGLGAFPTGKGAMQSKVAECF